MFSTCHSNDKKVIEIFFKYEPPTLADAFLNHVTDCLNELGIELKMKVVEFCK